MASDKKDLVDFLNHQQVCAALTVKEVEFMLDFMEDLNLKKGEIIAEIGEVGDALYFVVDGEAALCVDDGGQETEVGRMKQGELIGEMSFFDRVPRAVRIRAVKNNTRLLKLTRAMYERLRVAHPYIAVNLLEYAIISLDHLIRRTSEDMASFTRYLFAPGKK